MTSDMIHTINSKTDYLAMVKAVTGLKTSFTQDEEARLFAVYQDRAEKKFGFTNETLLRLLMVLDTAPDKTTPAGSPLAGALNKTDLDGFAALCGLHTDLEQEPEKARTIKGAALAGDVSGPLALALARAALDTYAEQRDLTPYRKDIEELVEFLKGADEASFTDACAFLVRVWERVR